MSNEKQPRSRKRVLFIAVGVLLFACAACGIFTSIFSDTTPAAETADRAAEIADIDLSPEPTDAPPTDEPAPTNEPPPTETATPIPPTATPLPTNTPLPTQTPIPPTDTPIPTATAAPLAAYPEIIAVNKQAEYVDIRNNTGADVNMAGWMLVSERGPQYCPLDGIGAFPTGVTIRIFALARETGPGEFSCGHGSEIWNNSQSDPAVLLAPGGIEVSRR